MRIKVIPTALLLLLLLNSISFAFSIEKRIIKDIPVFNICEPSVSPNNEWFVYYTSKSTEDFKRLINKLTIINLINGSGKEISFNIPPKDYLSEHYWKSDTTIIFKTHYNLYYSLEVTGNLELTKLDNFDTTNAKFSSSFIPGYSANNASFQFNNKNFLITTSDNGVSVNYNNKKIAFYSDKNGLGAVVTGLSSSPDNRVILYELFYVGEVKSLEELETFPPPCFFCFDTVTNKILKVDDTDVQMLAWFDNSRGFIYSGNRDQRIKEAKIIE